MAGFDFGDLLTRAALEARARADLRVLEAALARTEAEIARRQRRLAEIERTLREKS